MKPIPAIGLTSFIVSALVFGGCGKNPEPEGQTQALPSIPSIDPVSVPLPPPANPQPVLPATGQITTSAPDAPKPPAPPPELTPKQKQAVLDRVMQGMAKAQAEGLGGGTVTLNGAWQYSGYSHLAPNPDAVLPARLVAVDVTIKGHDENFDIDDIEIIDGLSMVSYGSDPHVTYLGDDAKPLGEDTKIPAGPDPARALLIYAFPESTPKFTLYYWGKNLLPEPMTFQENGWGLPYPKEAQ